MTKRDLITILEAEIEEMRLQMTLHGPFPDHAKQEAFKMVGVILIRLVERLKAADQPGA